MAFLSAKILVIVFGLLGNIVSFLVFLAPVPTCYKIYKRKSSEGFQSILYVVAFLSAALLLYYAFLKTNAFMIVSVNAFGCVIELTYLALFLVYAPKKSKMFTIKLILIFNVGGLGLVMLASFFLVKGPNRVTLVGWICACVNLAKFAAPLSIMVLQRKVIKTKSVEYMPFMLSLLHTIYAIIWFFYGFFVKDLYTELPNIVGFLLGIAQMILYTVYKDSRKEIETCQEKVEVEYGDEICRSGVEKQDMEVEVEVVVCKNPGNQLIT